jgi:hypothetical protein
VYCDGYDLCPNIFDCDAMMAKVHVCKLNSLIQFLLLLLLLIPSRSSGRGYRLNSLVGYQIIWLCVVLRCMTSLVMCPATLVVGKILDETLFQALPSDVDMWLRLGFVVQLTILVPTLSYCD